MFTGDGRTALAKDLLALAQYPTQSKVSQHSPKGREGFSTPHVV